MNDIFEQEKDPDLNNLNEKGTNKKNKEKESNKKPKEKELKKFIYSARDLNGKKIKGTFIAENETAMKESLAKNNLYLSSFKQVSNKKPNAFFSVTGKVSTNELCTFSKQFSVMISAGISIIDCIEILKNQSYSSLLRKTLNKMTEDLTSGLLLSQSMKKYPKVFPNFFTSMVFVGETSGKLDNILLSVADYYDRRQKTAKKIKSALAYPLTLVVLIVAILAVLLYFVIPTFISTFAQLNVEMPSLTMSLFNISNFVRTWWKEMVCIVFGVFLIFYLIGKTKGGRYFFDLLKLKLPILKNINMANFISTFTQSLGLLLSSGLDMVSALASINKIINNKYLEKKFSEIRQDVEKGMPLSQAIDINLKSSPILVQMISVGEKTGRLDSVMLQTFDYFDQQVDAALNLIVVFIQPTILLILGVSIAVIFAAIYMPILSMITSIDTGGSSYENLSLILSKFSNLFKRF